jgi:hypothetical protein
MSLATRLAALAQAIGADIKALLAGATREARAYTECVGAVNTDAFTYTVSGTGAAWASVAALTTQLGVLRLGLGTVATNRGSIAAPNMAVVRFGGGAARYQSAIAFVTPSDATNTYVFRDGFIDSITAESTDGAFFRYTNAVNAGKLQAVTRSNGVETATDTGITVTAGLKTRLKIEVNAAGTQALFYVNGTLVATNTTNIPTAAGRETGYGLYVQRTVGTVAVNAIDVDYIDTTIDYSTER